MKSIVIYNSQTGFTKKYAEWISEAAACECVEFKQAAKLNLSDYDAIVFLKTKSELCPERAR